MSTGTGTVPGTGTGAGYGVSEYLAAQGGAPKWFRAKWRYITSSPSLGREAGIWVEQAGTPGVEVQVEVTRRAGPSKEEQRRWSRRVVGRLCFLCPFVPFPGSHPVQARLPRPPALQVRERAAACYTQYSCVHIQRLAPCALRLCVSHYMIVPAYRYT